MAIFFVIYAIFIVVAVLSIIIKAASQANKLAAPSKEARKTIVETKKSDYSFKFGNHTDMNSHANQLDYQEEYSMTKMSAPERYQYLREKRELAKIMDPPLSEAERNVLGGH